MSKAMTYAQAIKIVEECCKKEMQKLAFDANLYERIKPVEINPYMKSAYEKRENIREALKVLKGQPRLV